MLQYRASRGGVIAWRQGADADVSATLKPIRHQRIRVRSRGARVATSYGVATSGTTLSPTTAALTFTGYAPDLSQSGNVALTPAVASVTLSGFAPAVSQSANQTFSPAAAAVSLAGYAPTVSQSNALNLQPGAAALTVSGFAPTVVQSGSISLMPAPAPLAILGFAPTVTRSGQTLIQTLQAALDPLVDGGSWYQVNTAEPPTYPYITFMRVVSVSNVSLNGPSNVQNTRVQVDVFTRSASQVEALGDAVTNAIAAAFPQSLPISSQDLYEDAVKAFRVLIEFSIWGDF